MKSIIRVFTDPCRLFVAGILTWSAVSHLDNPYIFLRSVYDYGILPPGLTEFAAAWMPLLQIVVAVALIVKMGGAGPKIVATGLLTTFAGVQTWILLSGSSVSCGCFGYSQEAIGPMSITFTAFCAIAAAISLLGEVSIDADPLTQ